MYSTDSFREALLKCVNLCGDADSVGAVCAQMAGAIYGVRAIPADWVRHVQRWDDGLTALKAYKLWAGITVTPPTAASIREVFMFLCVCVCVCCVLVLITS